MQKSRAFNIQISLAIFLVAASSVSAAVRTIAPAHPAGNGMCSTPCPIRTMNCPSTSMPCCDDRARTCSCKEPGACMKAETPPAED